MGVFLSGVGTLHVTTESHNFDLAIAATFHKAQGRTIARVLGCLDNDITYAKVFVLISRCKFFAHTKILPLQSGDYSRIADLRVADNLVAYMAGAASGAGFDAGAARAALDAHVLSQRRPRKERAQSAGPARSAEPGATTPHTRENAVTTPTTSPPTNRTATPKRRKASSATATPRPRTTLHGQENIGNFCYRNSTNAAITAVDDFSSHLLSEHDCHAWEDTLRSFATHLPAYLSSRHATTADSAQPLLGALTALTATNSPHFIGHAARRQLRTAQSASHLALTVAATRTLGDRVTIIGDRAFVNPDAGDEPLQTLPCARLLTPSIPIAAAALRDLCRHDRSSVLTVPSTSFAFRDFGNAQQDAAEYLTELERRCVVAPDPSVHEAQQLPPCCQYNGFDCDLAVVQVTCHAAARHSWLPDDDSDTRRTVIILSIPGERAAVHDTAPNASATLQSCLDALMLEDVLDGRRCDSCNLDRVPFTVHRVFDRLPRALAFHLGRGANDGPITTKNFRHIALPDTFDMAPYVRVPPATPAADALVAAGGQLRYRLVSIVVHHGATLRSGHYVAYRRGPNATQWECWDDERITQVQWSVVAQQAAYLAFYESVEPELINAVFPH